MKNYAVLSALGRDRVGIADELTEALDRFKISIDESRMATLGGQFAIILQISGEAEPVSNIENELETLGSKLGFHLQLQQINLQQPAGKGLPYIVESYSMDAPGIVHAVTAILKKHNINIEDLETDTSSAPWTGAVAFRMKAHVTIPPATSVSDLRQELIALERDRDIDIVMKPTSTIGPK
jgi:glycine cleavage system transcriptional repressor